jgi:hypothetical protein
MERLIVDGSPRLALRQPDQDRQDPAYRVLLYGKPLLECVEPHLERGKPHLPLGKLPALVPRLLLLVYQVEIRHRQLLQSQHCAPYGRQCLRGYNENLSIT